MTLLNNTVIVICVVFISQVHCHGQQCCTSCDNFHLLNQQFNSMLGSLSTLDDCKGYEFRITPKPAGFDESRVMCLQMGGDLIMHNLGPEGGQYHEEIRTFVAESISEKFFWVGVHDREEDRVFRFLNGTIYDPSNKEEDHLYHWDEDQPKGPNQHCVAIWYEPGRPSISLHDYTCAQSISPEHTGSKAMHGLCEIKKNLCF